MLNISESSVALLVEVMWEVLPSSSDAAEVFLNQIILDQESQSLRQVVRRDKTDYVSNFPHDNLVCLISRVRILHLQPPLTDLAIVLILTSNIGALKNRARVLLEAWLKQGTFPFSQLELVLSLRRSNEVK